ncbi:MAG TPA: DUF4446 family protein [Candidatus Limnocylindrales bacterium]|nr:DUF4446 family protein [Candidatus Limnocylindrales bacterium]
MEGLAGPVAILVAIVALVVALGAAAIVVRQGPRPVELSPGNARIAELERRLAQLGHRLELVEADVDGQHHGDVGGSTTSSTIQTAGVALSHVGLVRFDAFQDTGGAQSFALALIDDDGDGIVLTSLHSRQSTRLYVKGVRRGVADSPLSGEEVRAMQNAGITPTV